MKFFVVLLIVLLVVVLITMLGKALWNISRGGTKERLSRHAADLIRKADKASYEGRPALAESYLELYQAVLKDIREYDALERPRD